MDSMTDKSAAQHTARHPRDVRELPGAHDAGRGSRGMEPESMMLLSLLIEQWVQVNLRSPVADDLAAPLGA